MMEINHLDLRCDLGTVAKECNHALHEKQVLDNRDSKLQQGLQGLGRRVVAVHLIGLSQERPHCSFRQRIADCFLDCLSESIALNLDAHSSHCFIFLMLALLEGRARHHKRLPLLVSNIFGALSKHCNMRSLTLLTTSVDFVKVGRHRNSSLVTDSDSYIMLPTSAGDTEHFSKPLHLTLFVLKIFFSFLSY